METEVKAGGRPREFRNNSERQRAYRERKKAIERYERQDDAISKERSLEMAVSQECEAHRSAFYQWCVVEDRYPEWARRMYELNERWWVCRQATYHAEHIANGN